MSDAPMIVAASRLDRRAQAIRAQLADLIALQRADATPRELARMYAVSVTAYRAANLRATVIANVPYRVVDRQGDPVEKHPLNALIRDNPDLAEILEWSELTSCFWGHNLVYKRRAQGKRVTGLQWINPHLYRPRFDALGGRLVGFDISVNWHHVDYDAVQPEGFIVRADAIFTHGMDFDNEFDGVAPAEAAFDMAGIETEAAQTAVWFLRNRAVPAGLLQPKDDAPGTQPPTEAERNAMKRLINRVLRGARNAGKTLVSSGRWEWLLLQHRFDQVEFKAQHEIAREGVSMAFDVPLDLLLPTSATYAELYQSNKSWVDYFAKNRCKWYARQLTKQLAAEYGDEVRIEPVLSEITARDDAQTVAVTNNKLSGGYLTLYEAQKATGVDEPDERLKDVYLVGGEPVHIERLVKIAQEGRAAAWGDLGIGDAAPDGEQPDASGSNDQDGEDKLPPQKAARGVTNVTPQAGEEDAVLAADAPTGVTNVTPEPEPADVPAAVTNVTPGGGEDWLPDELFKELRDCVRVTARRGATYEFEPVHLPVDVVAYVRLLAATAGGDPDTGEIVTAARAYYRDTSDLRAMKRYADVEARYRATLYDLIRRAFARQIDVEELTSRGWDAIDRAYEAAFKEGLADAGTTVVKLTGAEVALLNEQALAERGYWTRLAGEVMERLVKVQEEIEAVRQQLGQATDPDEQEQLRAELLKAKQKLIANRDAVLGRLDLWVQGLRRMYSQGQLSGERNPMMLWRVDHAKENCRTCSALDGQVHRASEFAELELYPGSLALECVHSAKGVPVCGCGFKVVPGARPRGNLNAVPLFGSARSLGIAPAARSEYGEPSGTVVLYLDDKAAVLAVQDQIIAAHPALDDARWTRAGDLHLTLVHSALVADDAFADIFAEVMQQGVPAFELTASRVDAFEVGEAHRAVVLLIDASDELRDFQRRVYEAFRAREVPLSEHSDPAAWTPHVTLGYERAGVAFEPRDVAVTLTTDMLAFTRGDYQAAHSALPADPDVEDVHAV